MNFLTVPSSNSGRSLGDVFLALYSSNLLAKKAEPVGFFTHGNHAEVSMFFRKHLDVILLSDTAEEQSKQMDCVNAHWAATDIWSKKYPNVQSPWLYFIMNGVRPFELKLEIPPAVPKVPKKSVLIFPERSDNHRLGDSLFEPFVHEAKARGFTVYTNCYLNDNYLISPPIPGTEPISQLSLSDVIAIASDPENIIRGNRSGVFDLLYFAAPPDAAKLVIVYPPNPDWMWNACRFKSEFVGANFPEMYFERTGLFEFQESEFVADNFAFAFEVPADCLAGQG